MPTMDYSKLLGKIREKELNQKEVARKIGISEGQMCQKIRGKYLFKQSEIRNICDLLEIEQSEIGEYFFTPRVEKSQHQAK